MFEWQCGVRKNLPLIVLFYLVGLAGIYQMWLTAAAWWVLTMVFTSFYSEYEPLKMLRATDLPAGDHLLKKIAWHLTVYALVMLPLLLVAMIHPDFRWYAAGYFLASLNLVLFSILLKYHMFRPAAFSGAHQLLTTLAVIISVILPVAVLIALFNMYLLAGARRNLKNYLHA